MSPTLALITVLPEMLQSPLLTAEWENRLKQVERGELSLEDFMEAIAAMVRELAATCAPVPGGEVLFPSGKESIGPCPRCGGSVTENKKGFFCENPSCRFALWKDNRFFAAKRKDLDKTAAAALLNEGKLHLTGCWSEKTSKTYDATVYLEDDGEKTNYRLEFDSKANGCAATGLVCNGLGGRTARCCAGFRSRFRRGRMICHAPPKTGF